MKEAESMFSHRKDLAFHQACTREQAELLELQRCVCTPARAACGTGNLREASALGRVCMWRR